MENIEDEILETDGSETYAGPEGADYEYPQMETGQAFDSDQDGIGDPIADRVLDMVDAFPLQILVKRKRFTGMLIIFFTGILNACYSIYQEDMFIVGIIAGATVVCMIIYWIVCGIQYSGFKYKVRYMLEEALRE